MDKNPIVKRLQMRAEGSRDPARQLRIRAEGPHNPALVSRPRIDLGGTSSKNSSNRLVRPAQKLAKSVIQTSSKVHEPKTYDEAVDNVINRNGWQEAIDEELWNLNSFQTWFYTALSPNHKSISWKWVFKV